MGSSLGSFIPFQGLPGWNSGIPKSVSLIPFVAFDEKELETFAKNQSKRGEAETAEGYLKGVILEARNEPEVIRKNVPKITRKCPKSNEKCTAELSFKQLASSTFISKLRFYTQFCARSLGKIPKKYTIITYI